MRRFDYSRLRSQYWDIETINYLSLIHEARGKQTLYLKQKPDELEKLVEIAKKQSTEASNAIEGIRTTNTRLKQIVMDKTTPRDRDEQEIAGYKNALQMIHESFEYIPITPNYILQLHKILFAETDSAFGGEFKNVQNHISATDGAGNTYTLFTPPAPYETPAMVEELCETYNREVGKRIVDPLILIPIFIHDFLCIHPFVDGNGRMSRLLTTLLLYQNGYHVGKYISLEAKIEKNKAGYYRALEKAQMGWYEGEDDPLPFLKYLLGTIISAYRDFEDRAKLLSENLSSSAMVHESIQGMIGKFTKSDVMERCPSLSAATVERSLKKLCEDDQISRHGKSRGTYYLRKN